METAKFVAEDLVLDVGLLRIDNPRDQTALPVSDALVARGTSCGFLGFPLATMEFLPQGRRLNLQERFQGAYISNRLQVASGTNPPSPRYEIDRLMYSGSSGCPGFDIGGNVIGIQVATLLQPGVGTNAAQERIAIAFVVPSPDIMQFVRAYGVAV
jgi:S1-C subfamily serine protease